VFGFLGFGSAGVLRGRESELVHAGVGSGGGELGHERPAAVAKRI
jgi:hypothetical protein